MKRALMTGITGQDGTYLAESLDDGYEVHGMVRRSSTFSPQRFVRGFASDAQDRLHLHYGDLVSDASIDRLRASKAR